MGRSRLDSSLICFNSIKVRLRRRRVGDKNNRCHRFNSIKVRLRHFHKFARAVCAWFQFHKGSIKTYLHRHGISVSDVFQFHKGSIKTKFMYQVILSPFRFNSIKVRLRPPHRHMGESPCFLAFPNAKIRKKRGKTCRCGIIKKYRGCDNSFVYQCFNMSKSERINFLSYNSSALADIDNFYRKLSVDIRSLPSISLSIL